MSARLAVSTLAAAALTLLAGVFLPQYAHAGVDRTVRGRIYFHNGRIQYSTGNGSLLTNTGSSGDDAASMSFVQYQVIAKCGSSMVMGGKKYAAENGYFEQKFSNTCSTPRFAVLVYYRSRPEGSVYHQVEVGTTGNLHVARVPDAGGYYQSKSSDFSGGKMWRSLNVSCTAQWAWSCPNPDNDDDHRAANIYKSGIDVWDRWGYRDHGEYGAFRIQYPHPEGSSSAGITTIKASSDVWDDNHRVAHELGHAYQKRLMDLNDSLSGPGWCSGHSWHATPDLDPSDSKTKFSQACATAEGWADFFAAATYFQPNAVRPYYSFCGDNCDSGTTAECGCGGSNLSTACKRQCRSGKLCRQLVDLNTWNRAWDPAMGSGGNEALFKCVRDDAAPTSKYPDYAVEGNVARFFWDAFDTRPDGTMDTISLSRSKLLSGWAAMPKSGFGNGKVREPMDSSGDWDDRNGRNLRDYIREGGFTSSQRSALEKLLERNCVDEQTDS